MISDHAPLSLDIQFSVRKSSPPLWKCNSLLLADTVFCNFVSDAIDDSDSSTMNQFLADVAIPTVDPVQSEQLEAPFSVNELKQAIEYMQSNKSPGPDGFPI